MRITKKIDAVFSSCGLYRYVLLQVWDRDKPQAMFIGLNPSTADEQLDDPTIRRCKRFACDWGYGGLVMTNLFAVRATNPKVMLSINDHPDIRQLFSFMPCKAVNHQYTVGGSKRTQSCIELIYANWWEGDPSHGLGHQTGLF